MTIRSQMSSIMGQMEAEYPELFALEFGKITESDFVYTLASTNINQSAANFVKMYVTIRSRMSLIMDLIDQKFLTTWGKTGISCDNFPLLFHSFKGTGQVF